MKKRGTIMIEDITDEIPEFFSMGFGMVLAYYFGKKKASGGSDQ